MPKKIQPKKPCWAGAEKLVINKLEGVLAHDLEQGAIANGEDKWDWGQSRISKPILEESENEFLGK